MLTACKWRICAVALFVFGGTASLAQTPVPPTVPPLTPQQQTGINQLPGDTAGRAVEGTRRLSDEERQALQRSLQGPPNGQALSPEAASLKVKMTGVRFEGNTVFLGTDFAELYGPLVGQEVTLGQLASVANDIQTFYRMEGYVFTRAFVPRDGINDGVVTFRVLEGVIGDVTVEESGDPVGPVMDLMTRMANQLEGIRSPHIEDLERILLMMNDVPGITRATAVPRAGQGDTPGQIDIVINVERQPLAGILFADNRQAPSAGRGLIGAAVEYASYTSAGDTTQLTFLNSFWADLEDLKERRVFQVEHSRYLHENGLQAWFRGLYGVTNLGADLDPLAIEGEQYELEAGLRYPLIRTRPITLVASASFEFSELENDILAGSTTLTNDNLRIFTIGLDGLMRDSTGFTAIGLNVRQGSSILGASQRNDAFLSRADGNPEGTVAFGSIERDQEIYAGFSANVLAEGQFAWSQLLASQEYQLGGTGIGRGYDPSELSGDHGFGIAAELRYTRPMDFVPLALLSESTVQVYGFYDYGRVFNIGAGIPDVADLSSYGGGLRFDLPYQVFVELEVAKPVERIGRTGENEIRVFFEAQKRF